MCSLTHTYTHTLACIHPHLLSSFLLTVTLSPSVTRFLPSSSFLMLLCHRISLSLPFSLTHSLSFSAVLSLFPDSCLPPTWLTFFRPDITAAPHCHLFFLFSSVFFFFCHISLLVSHPILQAWIPPSVLLLTFNFFKYAQGVIQVGWFEGWSTLCDCWLVSGEWERRDGVSERWGQEMVM